MLFARFDETEKCELIKSNAPEEASTSEDDNAGVLIKASGPGEQAREVRVSAASPLNLWFRGGWDNVVRIRARATKSVHALCYTAAGVQGGGCRCGAPAASTPAAVAAGAAIAVAGRGAGKGGCEAREGQAGAGRVPAPPA